MHIYTQYCARPLPLFIMYIFRVFSEFAERYLLGTKCMRSTYDTFMYKEIPYKNQRLQIQLISVA
jgi:hypothetical protein